MWDNLFSTSDFLHKGIEAAWLRNSVIRNNIANVETPGFKASDVKFESVFRNAINAIEDDRLATKLTRDRHFDFHDYSLDFSPYIVKREDTSMRYDENNVDIEDENVKLAQNSILYNTMVSQLNSELNKLRTAITG
ncbi:MAG: flagellar basal body rod protein FlgB [Oscillospiraceae bacterium]|jgi:flagellar basal-body rod protein FlgB|nr:flagellar basal body rod protein FlgB [Oscillospiraceae bacterium]